MIDIIVSTPNGLILSNNNVVSILLHSHQNGEFMVLKDHIAVVSTISPGYAIIKTDDNKELYIALDSALFEFSDNKGNIIANQAFMADSLENANAGLAQDRTEMLAKNKESEQKFVAQEIALRESIKKMRSGHL